MLVCVGRPSLGEVHIKDHQGKKPCSMAARSQPQEGRPSISASGWSAKADQRQITFPAPMVRVGARSHCSMRSQQLKIPALLATQAAWVSSGWMVGTARCSRWKICGRCSQALHCEIGWRSSASLPRRASSRSHKSSEMMTNSWVTEHWCARRALRLLVRI